MSARSNPIWGDEPLRRPWRRSSDLGLALLIVPAVGAAWIAVMVLGGPAWALGGPSTLMVGLVMVVGVGVAGMIVMARRHATTVRDRTDELVEHTALTRFVLDTASDAVITIDAAGSVVEANLAAEHMFGTGASEMVGRDAVTTIVAAPDRDHVTQQIERLSSLSVAASIDSREPVELLRADGTAFSAELLATATGRGAARRIHLFAHDASHRVAAERAVSEHVEDLAALLKVARELSGSEAAQESRRAICRAARQLSAGEFAHVFELDAERNVLRLTASDGSGIDFLELPLTGRTSLLSDAFRSGEATFSGDMLIDARADREAAARVGIRAGCFQPIVGDGRTIGVLVVGWRQPIETLSPRIASLLALFATQVAAVLERADLIARLADLARTDSLTGLANRRALDESLARELDRADRTDQPLTVAMIDMDHFKRFNDQRGHQAGDWLLAETARAWSRELRPSDTLARYGGEEFVVVLPNCSADAGIHAIERLRGVVPAGQTCSAGIATRSAGEASDALLKRADAAMYVAKRAGRDRTVTAPMQALPRAPAHRGPPKPEPARDPSPKIAG